jgi:DNA-binding transcriptional MerR regulator
MGWSTSELAELAGTSVSTIRFYHRRGLLPEPERQANGYKQYTTAHLMSLLRMKRLADLGVPLAEIAEIERTGTTAPDLSHIEAGLEETIAKLRRAQNELAELARHGAPIDLPPGFSDIADTLSPSDRQLVMIFSRVYGPDEMKELHRQFSKPGSAAASEFEALPADADEATRADLAARLVVEYRREWNDDADLRGLVHGGELGSDLLRRVLSDAFEVLYNPAQLDVYRLIYEDIQREPLASPPSE